MEGWRVGGLESWRVEGLEGWRVGEVKGLLHFGRRPASRQKGLRVVLVLVFVFVRSFFSYEVFFRTKFFSLPHENG